MEDLIKGIFVKEIKNRFLCEVNIDGSAEECYISSSCRLSNFIDLSGRVVLLRRIQSKKARTRYAVYAVKHGRRYIPLELAMANRVIEATLPGRRFAFLGKRKAIQREVTIDGYKCDLYVPDSQTIIEIKSVLTLEHSGLFPTVFSERAIQQLELLKRLMDSGYKVCYIFVSLNPRVEAISINKECVGYYESFKECVEKGMQVCGFSIKLTEQEPVVHKAVKILL